jgi:hypothetical protein
MGVGAFTLNPAFLHQVDAPQGDVFLEAWPALYGVLPSQVLLKVFAQHHALREIA